MISATRLHCGCIRHRLICINADIAWPLTSPKLLFATLNGDDQTGLRLRIRSYSKNAASCNGRVREPSALPDGIMRAKESEHYPRLSRLRLRAVR